MSFLAVSEAMQQISEILKKDGFIVNESYDGIMVRLNGGFWASEAEFYVYFQESRELMRYKGGYRDGGFDYHPVSYKLSVNWSSTQRTISMAIATIEIYSRITKAAAMVDAFLSSNTIGIKKESED